MEFRGEQTEVVSSWLRRQLMGETSENDPVVKEKLGILRPLKEDTHWCLYFQLLVHFTQWSADPGSRLLRALWRKFLLSTFLGCLIFGLSADHLA